jgi:methylamine utilization protein MauE
MGAVTFIQTAAALAMAGVLLWAGLEKFRDFAPAAATVGELGLPRVLAGPAALLVAAAEVGVGLALLFRPGATATHLGVVLLACHFALAGLLALRSGRQIRCHCFGAGGRGHLGKPQLVALVPWLAGAALLRLGAQQAPPLPAGAAYFAAVSLFIAGVRGVAVRRALLEARGDRLSAQEMYRWLRSR